MKIYERDSQFLFIIPELPQWFIVDAVGKEVAKAILNGETMKEACAKLKDLSSKAEIMATYKDIKRLIGTNNNGRNKQVFSSLTSKTTVAMISVTRKCNLKCPHCYVDARGTRGRELSLDEHRNLAKSLYEKLATKAGVGYKVNITGGEPFCHSDILNIISAYKESGFDVTMSTNALLIEKRDFEELYRNRVAVSISLDGATPETHDLIRGKGAFKKVIDQIKRLVNSGVRVGINHLLHDGNAHELEILINLCYQLGCNGFNPINLVQLGRACDSNLKRVSEVKVFRRIGEHLKKHPEQIRMFMFSSLFSSLGAALLAGVACQNCGIGDRPCVYVAETGDVFPCPNTQKDEFKMGNIRTDEFAVCVNLEHVVLQKLRAIKVDSMNVACASCDVRYFCGGDCRGETYNVTGDLRAPYVACKDRHDSLIELMWIVASNPEFFNERASEYLQNSRGI